MVKVVEGGQLAATQARFSPGVRTGLHVVAAEATDTPRPIAIETARTSKSFFTFPLLSRCSLLTEGSTIIAASARAPIRVAFASAPMPASIATSSVRGLSEALDASGPSLVRASENSGKNLSEQGSEQRSERGFGRCTEREKRY